MEFHSDDASASFTGLEVQQPMAEQLQAIEQAVLKSLRSQIKEAAGSQTHPATQNDNVEGTSSDRVPMGKRTTPAGYVTESVSGPINFQLPEDCVNHILQMEKVAADSGDNQVTPLISFSERVKGWMIETRKRPNEKRDKFYYQETYEKMFRSMEEVAKFIKYGRCLNKTVSKKRKIPRSNSDDVESRTIHEQLEDAYNNMLNLCRGEENEDPNSNRETPQSKSHDHGSETIREQLAEAYNNLLNLFNPTDNEDPAPCNSFQHQDDQEIKTHERHPSHEEQVPQNSSEEFCSFENFPNIWD